MARFFSCTKPLALAGAMARCAKSNSARLMSPINGGTIYCA